MNELLKEEIEYLISLKHEGEYWDFKKQWYEKEKKPNLLHDIICMANNLVNKDAYIIIGIDEKNDYQVSDVTFDSNRWSTQNLVDFLGSKEFAGRTRPQVSVESIELDSGIIDVIIVKNSNNTPYFLIKHYNSVHENNIYTRVKDTNTPIDKTADMNHIEYLWRKRFGLDLPILDRLSVVLSDIDAWNIDWGNKNYAYNSCAPEYKMICDEELTEGWLPQAAFYCHPCCHYTRLKILYHDTIIYETTIWAFDHFRTYLPTAKTCRIEGIGDFWYSYYDLSSIEGKLLTVFTNGSNSIFSRGIDYHQFLIFSNETERKEFNSFLAKNFNKHSDSEIKEKYRHQIEIDEREENNDGYLAFQVGKAALLYEEWKKHIDSETR